MFIKMKHIGSFLLGFWTSQNAQKGLYLLDNHSCKNNPIIKATASQLVQNNLGTNFSLTPSPQFFGTPITLFGVSHLYWTPRERRRDGKLASFGRKPEEE